MGYESYWENTGWTLLHKAAARRQESVIQSLIDNGAIMSDVAHEEDEGEDDEDPTFSGTRLHMAIGDGSNREYRIIQILLDHEAEINAKGDGGFVASGCPT